MTFVHIIFGWDRPMGGVDRWICAGRSNVMRTAIVIFNPGLNLR